MKTRLIPVLLVVAIIIGSCTKTDTKTITNVVTTIDSVTPIEMPVQSLITKGVEADSGYKVPLSLEVGNEFFASDSGVITKLGGLLTVKNLAYTVSLWDTTGGHLLAQTTITTTDTTKFVYAPITAVNISANKRYMVTFNSSPSGSFLAYRHHTGASTVYPFSDGSITFTDAYYITSSTPIFPTTVQPSYLIPVDIVFQAVK